VEQAAEQLPEQFRFCYIKNLFFVPEHFLFRFCRKGLFGSNLLSGTTCGTVPVLFRFVPELFRLLLFCHKPLWCNNLWHRQLAERFWLFRSVPEQIRNCSGTVPLASSFCSEWLLSGFPAAVR
jgi:hypothetical protein